eukprot:7485_1
MSSKRSIPRPSSSRNSAKNVSTKPKFTKARIKQCMQADEETGRIAAHVPEAMSCCLELLVSDLMGRVQDDAARHGAVNLTAANLKNAIETCDKFDFLKDVVSGVSSGSRANNSAHDIKVEEKNERKSFRKRKTERNSQISVKTEVRSVSQTKDEESGMVSEGDISAIESSENELETPQTVQSSSTISEGPSLVVNSRTTESASSGASNKVSGTQSLSSKTSKSNIIMPSNNAKASESVSSNNVKPVLRMDAFMDVMAEGDDDYE